LTLSSRFHFHFHFHSSSSTTCSPFPFFLSSYFFLFLPPSDKFAAAIAVARPEIVPDSRSVLVSPPLPPHPPTTSSLSIPTFPPATPCYVVEQVPFGICLQEPLRKSNLPTALVVSQEPPGPVTGTTPTRLASRDQLLHRTSSCNSKDYKNSSTARPIFWWLHELAVFPALPRPRPFPSTPAHPQPWPLG